jgi:hypothetical protein
LLSQQHLALFGQAVNTPIFYSDDTELYMHTVDRLLLVLKGWGQLCAKVADARAKTEVTNAEAVEEAPTATTEAMQH